MNTARTFASLLAAAATAALLTTTASNAFAAPDTGSASGSSGCGTRSSADQLFLNSYAEAYDTCDSQDAAIQLARAECNWLRAYGNSAHNQIVIAERSRPSVKYPYIFLDAAITAYCPQYEI